jgi:hypothetical protein
MSTDPKDWIEIVYCPHCGTEIVRDWKPHPNGLYGNHIKCPSFICGKEFTVNSAILKDRDAPKGILEIETQKGLQPRQSVLDEFLK